MIGWEKEGEGEKERKTKCKDTIEQCALKEGRGGFELFDECGKGFPLSVRSKSLLGYGKRFRQSLICSELINIAISRTSLHYINVMEEFQSDSYEAKETLSAQ